MIFYDFRAAKMCPAPESRHVVENFGFVVSMRSGQVLSVTDNAKKL